MDGNFGAISASFRTRGENRHRVAFFCLHSYVPAAVARARAVTRVAMDAIGAIDHTVLKDNGTERLMTLDDLVKS